MKTGHIYKQHSITVYFFLAFIISWGIIVAIAGAGNIPIDPERSTDLLPMLYVSMLIGPTVAGLLMIGLVEGRKGFRRLMSGLFRWKVGFLWYLGALFATPLLAILILLFLSLVSPEIKIELPGEGVAGMALSGLFAGLMVGLFEEIGWTGFVVPRLTLRFNMVKSGLILGLLWGLWHFILFWENDSFTAALPLAILLARLFAWLPPFRILLVWIFTRTGSLLLTILTHASLVFTTTVIVPMTLTGTALLTWILTWGVVLWIVAAVLPSFRSR